MGILWLDWGGSREGMSQGVEAILGGGRQGVAPKPCPHLGAWQAPSAFPLLQDEANLGKELHAIPRFPAKEGQAQGQQNLPEAQGSQHVPPHPGPANSPHY